jgi:xanthine dehydrogenase YagT iron-sulfur-binding subunit
MSHSHAPDPPTPANTGPSRHIVSLKVNGQTETLDLEAWVSLLDLLRDRLGLTGTKKGCDHGQCGACTVLVDGRRINACLRLAAMCEGAEITTIEGVGQGSTLHPFQQAFIDHDALQCGYCTPGQICSAMGLRNEGQASSADEVRELMSGNLCRCGAYPQIVAAVSEVVLQVQER